MRIYENEKKKSSSNANRLIVFRIIMAVIFYVRIALLESFIIINFEGWKKMKMALVQGKVSKKIDVTISVIRFFSFFYIKMPKFTKKDTKRVLD